jgi:hypothetical protein
VDLLGKYSIRFTSYQFSSCCETFLLLINNVERRTMMQHGALEAADDAVLDVPSLCVVQKKSANALKMEIRGQMQQERPLQSLQHYHVAHSW